MAENKPFRPMLACETPEPLDLLEQKGHYPLLQSPKLDGIRAMVIAGTVYSRTLKPIRSDFVQKVFGKYELNGFDGELICGDSADPNVYQKTYSAVMTHGCTEPVSFYLFDDIKEHRSTYRVRLDILSDRWKMLDADVCRNSYILEQRPVVNLEEVLRIEEQILGLGYEGCILRRMDRPYKFGRSTLSEGSLIKLKRFVDDEALVIGLEEKMHNANEATIDARGYTHRTTHKGNKRGLGTLGAMVVKDLKTGDVFNIGVFKGLDDAAKQEIWNNPDKYVNKAIVKYRHLTVGRVELPRHPRFYEWGGFRDPDDMDATEGNNEGSAQE